MGGQEIQGKRIIDNISVRAACMHGILYACLVHLLVHVTVGNIFKVQRLCRELCLYGSTSDVTLGHYLAASVRVLLRGSVPRAVY